MEEIKKSEAIERPEKMSYEQLENIAHQLSEQCRQMASNIRERDLTYTFKRLDYLFKVLEFKDMFNAEFVNKCMVEITEIMTPPIDEQTELNNKKSE